MSGNLSATTWSMTPAAEDGGAWRNLLGLLLGTVFTLGIFLGIAHYQRRAPDAAPPVLDDLHVVFLPVQPPPVPVPPTEVQAEFTPMAGFELARAESPVRIAVSPPDLSALLPEDLSKAPPANARFNTRIDFKPKMTFLDDAQHIYQRSELDQPLQLLERPDPQVPSRVRQRADVLRVSLMAVVEASGEVTHIRVLKSSGNDEFDQLMVEAIKEWIFSSPTKGGRKVRCLIEQGITVQWSGGSPFSA